MPPEIQLRTFSWSKFTACVLFFSAFCSNLAFAAAALSGGRAPLALEPSMLDNRLGALASAEIDFCLATSPDVRVRIIAGLGGLEGMTNIEGRGLA
jgi:hypothetical protein